MLRSNTESLEFLSTRGERTSTNAGACAVTVDHHLNGRLAAANAAMGFDALYKQKDHGTLIIRTGIRRLQWMKSSRLAAVLDDVAPYS
jgi:hypothetical protein